MKTSLFKVKTTRLCLVRWRMSLALCISIIPDGIMSGCELIQLELKISVSVAKMQGLNIISINKRMIID